jgi:hypothetical protein
MQSFDQSRRCGAGQRRQRADFPVYGAFPCAKVTGLQLVIQSTQGFEMPAPLQASGSGCHFLGLSFFPTPTSAAPQPPYRGRFEFVEVTAFVGQLRLRHIYDYLDVEYVLDVDTSLVTLGMEADLDAKSMHSVIRSRPYPVVPHAEESIM